ncbi:MAG: sulfatase-like hydrolase/transferase [Deltaproteobacteria bacterium]|nr:sulfatase-like hydrolase/transferase [Deltaproteobacteria bacterium]
MRPAHRFVDARLGLAGGASGEAIIRDEQRMVLRAHASAPLLHESDVALPADGSFRSQLELPDALSGAERILVSPMIQIDQRWELLPPVLAAVSEGRQVTLQLDLPEEAAGAKATVALQGHRPLFGPGERIATASIDVVAGARLDFGIGILELARSQGPVAFSVEACEEEAGCRELFRELLASEPAGWHDRSLALDELAGRRVRFEFATEILSPAEQAWSLPLWSNPTLFVPSQRRAEDFNIVLISLDTLRADHLTSYGYPLDTAPFMDEHFGQGGTIFDNPVAAAASTGPSHMSIFTGLYPSVHNVVEGLNKLSPVVPTLAEALRDHGFVTGAITENAAIVLGKGFGRGFESYLENKGSDVWGFEGQVDRSFDRAVEFFERRQDQRFFLFLHTYQVHYPYAPPEAYAALFPEPPAGRPPHASLSPERNPALYDREIRYVDDQMRRLFEAMEARGIADETLVVVTSDHGDEFMEHGLLDHGGNVHDDVVNVPLLFHGPGVPAGRRVAQPTGHVDVMPTLLDLVGAAPPALVQGRSMAALLRGEVDALEERPVYSETWVPWARVAGQKKVRRIQTPTIGVRLGDRKLVRHPKWNAHGYKLYDLASDPREEQDLYREQRDAAGDLQKLLDTYLERSAERRKEIARREREAALESERDLTIDPEREEKLRALGYLE